MIEIGSIWKEHDNRFDRRVEVVSYNGGTTPRVGIKTIWRDGPVDRERVTVAAASAFGKRYRLVSHD